MFALMASFVQPVIVVAGLPAAGIMAGRTTAVQAGAGANARGRVCGALAGVTGASAARGVLAGFATGAIGGHYSRSVTLSGKMPEQGDS